MNGTGVAEDKSAPREEAEKRTQYSVAPPPPESVVDAARKRIAIFVAHGMGQQIPFETLDAIAESLRAYDESLTGHREKPTSKSVGAGDQWLQRVELNLKSGADRIEAHVYEGYWAPLTEGRITLRQVMSFLTGAASNGMKIARKTFKRWLMGEYHAFPTPIRIVLYLLVALATVEALVALNSIIVTVAAARALFSQRPWWLTNGLFEDLTTTFNAVVTTMVVFAASLLIAHIIRRPRIPVIARKIWGGMTVVVFFLTLLAIILAGLSVLSLLFLHVRGNVAADAQLWQRFLSKDWIDHFNARFDSWGLWSVLAVVFVTLLSWVIVLLPKLRRDLAESRGRLLTIAVLLAFTFVVVAIILVALRFFGVLLPWREN